MIRSCIPTCLSKVIAPTLPVNDVLVDLAGSDVVIPSEGNPEIAFIISKIEIGLTPVI